MPSISTVLADERELLAKAEKICRSTRLLEIVSIIRSKCLRRSWDLPKTRKMDSKDDILRLAGEALYGRQWQTPLSRDLGVTDRTVRNWLICVNRPADLAERILPLLRARGEHLTHIIALAERLQHR